MAARRIVLELVIASDSLELFPQRGRPGLVPGTRELVAVWPDIMVYETAGETVSILRVWLGARSRR